MKTRKIIIGLISSLALSFLCFAQDEAAEKVEKKVAVLYFENHASEQYDRFVRGMSDMLMTSLGQAENLTVIERVQIEKAMENFSLELTGPIDAKKAVEVGKWLGADAVVLGSFTRFGEKFRIDARLIEAKTGALLIAQHVRGAEGEVFAMVDQLGEKLIDSFGEKETEVKGENGFLRVRFMIARAEMTERPVYYQIGKLFIDGKEMEMSPVVQEVDKWMTLFSGELSPGRHDVQVIHGFVDQEGGWDGELPKQPKIFRVMIEPGSTTTIQYSYGIGWFNEAYYYEPPWKGRPK